MEAPITRAQHAFHEGRGNLIISYASSDAYTHTVSFVGSHLDVVPADPATWCVCCAMHACRDGARTVDPFHMTVQGDKLFGRGTTDVRHRSAATTLTTAVPGPRGAHHRPAHPGRRNACTTTPLNVSQLAEKKPQLKFKVVAVFIARHARGVLCMWSCRAAARKTAPSLASASRSSWRCGTFHARLLNISNSAARLSGRAQERTRILGV